MYQTIQGHARGDDLQRVGVQGLAIGVTVTHYLGAVVSIRRVSVVRMGLRGVILKVFLFRLRHCRRFLSFSLPILIHVRVGVSNRLRHSNATALNGSLIFCG